jgi:hypothetical protein
MSSIDKVSLYLYNNKMSFENFDPSIQGDASGAIEDKIPDKCRKCPFVQGCLEEVKMNVARKSITTVLGGQLMGQPGEQFDESIRELARTQEEADEFTALTRHTVAGELDSCDASIKHAEQTIRNATETCTNPLKMRASNAGASYVVTVCTSPLAYENDDGSIGTIKRIVPNE